MKLLVNQGKRRMYRDLFLVNACQAERGGPKITFRVLFYRVADANFDSHSYMTYQEGYWLTREGMKWF